MLDPVSAERHPAEEAIAGMVLCAGLGTRLRPLTERLPKPAVPLCGLPLVQYALALLAGAGVRRAVVNTHHLAEEMAGAARGAAAATGLSLQRSHEPVIAGTGGALREARPLLAGAREIILVNGDVLVEVDLRAALAAHRATGALATMVLMAMPPGARYNAVEVDGAGCVRRIAGKYGPGGDGLRSFHFTGVHVLSSAVLDAVPAQPFANDVNHEVYPALMAEGKVRAHFIQGYWNDLGTPARYLQANLDLLGGRVGLGPFPGADPFSGARPGSQSGLWMAPGARIAPGATIEPPVLLGPGVSIEDGAGVGPGVVAGAGARIGAGAQVREAVLWDGTEVGPGERIERAVAAPGLRVDAG
jgi:mannose-1-phosphate guanylyltransferase